MYMIACHSGLVQTLH